MSEFIPISAFQPQRPYQLKIKAKSLAAEATIIRTEEHKMKRWQLKAKAALKDSFVTHWREQRLSLQGHRKGPVRVEARSTHLARTFLSGKPYISAEAGRYLPPDWAKTWAMIQRYGMGDQRDLAQQFEAWKQTGESACKLL